MKARPDMEERLLDEALAWQNALQGDDADWAGYTRWLEADPRHRLAFDELALLERAVDDRRADLRRILAAPAEPRRAEPMRRRRFVGGIVAAIALAVAVPALRPVQRPADGVFATAVGQSRRITLPGGVTIDLAPASRLVARGGNPNDLELAQGEAYFAVAHDPARMLAVHAGSYRVTDIGTRFAMNLAADALLVSVSDGQVAVAPRDSRRSDKVSAGQRLLAAASGGSPRLSPITTSDVGSWRRGELVYDGAPLKFVAADIARFSGKAVTVDPAIAMRRFSGVLAIGDGSRLLANLAEFMPISIRAEGDGMRIDARPAS